MIICWENNMGFPSIRWLALGATGRSCSSPWSPPHIPDFAVLLVLQLVLLVALLPLLTVLAPIGVMSVDGAGV